MLTTLGGHRVWPGDLAAVVLLALLMPARLAAGGGRVIFADGFESGDLCAWTGTCPHPAAVTGVWVGALDFDGANRALSLQLHQRGDGTLLGYVLGGTHKRSVLEGSYFGGSLSVELEFVHPQAVRTVLIAGTVSGQILGGTASGDIATQPVTFHRWEGTLHERRFVFMDPALGGGALQEVVVVLDDGDRLFSGGFAPPRWCDLWACDGGVTAFDESGGTLTIGLETDGGCSAGSFLAANFDAGSGLYTGSYTFTSCSGTTSGSLIGGRTTRTRSDHVAQVLAALGGIADQFEAGLPFTAPHPAFAADFSHNGKDLTSLFAEWNAELAAYMDIQASFPRIKLISTVDEPTGVVAFRVPLGAVLDQLRSGVPVPGGTAQVYLDSSSEPAFNVARNDLRVFEESSGQWRISGNRQAVLDLPWLYTINSLDGRLDTPTAGNPIHVAPGVYAAHFIPHTGHAYGDPKANNSGFLPADDSEMEELIGDGVGDDDGICEEGEDCAYWGELDGSGVRDRRPVYLSRQDGEVTRILFVNGPTGVYFDDVPQWRLAIRYPSGLTLELDHVGTFVPAFAARVLVATGCDPNDWASCGLANGTDILEGLDPLPVNSGEELCHPQMLADEVTGYPGYYVGGGSFLDYPWAQMEFVAEPIIDGIDANVCVYELLPRSRVEELQTAMDTDMLNPESQRYALGLAWPRWQWGAEGRACNAPAQLPLDFSSLYTNLGGWYERSDSAAANTPDELFAYAPIAKDVAAWDPALYDPADPDALVLRRKALGAPPFVWEMPGGGGVSPAYPAGELLEDVGGVMLVKWREIGFGAPVYQRAAYLLDENGLKIEWGNFADAPAGAIAPSLDPGDPCDDLVVLCYSHEAHPGY